MHSTNHVRGGNLRPEAKLGHRTEAVRPSACSLVRNTRAMTLLTMLAHERAATIVVAVRAVTFVLVERGYGGARMSCGTALSFQQREQLVEGSTRAHLPDLITSLLGCQELSCLRERLRSCKALQWRVQRQACPRLGGVIKGSVGNNCLRQIEFRVVFHPSVHLFLGVCNGLTTFCF